MKKIKLLSLLFAMLLTALLVAGAVMPAFADEPQPVAVAEEEAAAPAAEDNATGVKAIAAAVVVGIVAAVGALSMGLAISKSTESMARQPEAAGSINSAMMLGLVFIETAIIYALIVAILVIFVL